MKRVRPKLNRKKKKKKKDPPYVIKRSATGLGLFATREIRRGQKIIEYTGPLTANEIVDKSNRKYFFGVNRKWSIDGSGRDNIARYINHSCKPNAEARISHRRVWIWASKKIKPGAEIAYDYGKEYFEGVIEPMGCKCNGCRKSFASKVMASRQRSREPF
jgi:uncharacterized protein